MANQKVARGAMISLVCAQWIAVSVTTVTQGAEQIIWKDSGKGGAVAAGGGPAVAAGIQLLEQNGNAADAAAATLLALTVTDYGWCAMGGEVPLLIYDAKKQEVKVLCGLGRAPLDPKAIEWYYANGIPANGSMRAAPTPGHLDLCVTLLKLYGTKSFEEAATPALMLMETGKLNDCAEFVPRKNWNDKLAVNLAATLRKCIEAEQNADGTREEKLTAARDRFHKGDIADELEAWYIETGSFLRKRDLAAHRTILEDPVSVQYRGHTIYKCGPWTQGPYLCQTLRLLEGFRLKEMGHLSTDYIHVLTEALKLGFADRDEYYGDPTFVDVPLKPLLSNRYTELRRPLIDMTTASMAMRPGDPRAMRSLKVENRKDGTPADIPVQDTTTCVVADRWGNVVAATPSCNLAGNQPGPSGITQGNRLRSLNTTPGHANRIQPGKRPRITLTPTLVTRNGKPIVAISVAGGDLQDQTTLNVLLNHIEFGMLPDKAVTTPRFNTDHHQHSFNPIPDREKAIVGRGRLTLNTGIAPDVVEGLKALGHKLTSHKDEETKSGAIGHPVMIYIDPSTRMMYAAGDPKANRHAAVLD
jgi:gamma-glutamyltranspeptidase / glutathione hydrolase